MDIITTRGACGWEARDEVLLERDLAAGPFVQLERVDREESVTKYRMDATPFRHRAAVDHKAS